MKGFLIGLSKVILGMVIALALLSMAGVTTARYFMTRLAVLPPKPLYGEELPTPPGPVATAPEAADAPPTAVAPAPVPTPGAEPEAKPETEPETEPTPDPTAEELPPGSYQAVVVQPIGLVIRSGPGTDNNPVGSVDYNAAIIVLEEPTGQGWMKVRVPSSGAEGWIKAGNVRRQE